MPTYDYLCEACGPFTQSHPMSEAALPRPCPACGESAGRAFLTMPRISGMDRARALAHATNERSAHEPKRSGAHGPGCSCCASGTKRAAALHGPDGSRMFPANRPWMISH